MAAAASRSKPAGLLSRRRQAPRPKSRKKLFEWGVLYPVLIGSLLTAGPQWIDSLRAVSEGINAGSIEEAKQQAELWKKNIACAAAPYAWFNNPSNIKVDATLCDSGDIFVRASTPDNAQHFKWIPLSDIVDLGEDGSVIPAAKAATLPLSVSQPDRATPDGVLMAQAQANVICQKFIDDRHLLRRVQTPQGCFDEVIDTFNGSVVSRKAVPCTPQC